MTGDCGCESCMTWTTAELTEEFTILGFTHGYVGVQRKADGIVGSLSFRNDTHGRRIYTDWKEDR